MSQETMQWLNTNVLYGFTAHRHKWEKNGFAPDGKAWWVKGEMEGHPNIFKEAVPLERVEKLFGFDVVTVPVYIKVYGATVEDCDGFDEDGGPYWWVEASDYKGVYRKDEGTLFNITSEGYRIHQYPEWLIRNVATILDTSTHDGLGIESAMILRRGAVAAVTVTLPDDVVVDKVDFAFRPHLIACTSMDSTYATSYLRGAFISVCDNGIRMNVSGAEKHGQVFKVRHTAKSLSRVGDARAALGIVYQMSEEMTQAIEWLSDWDVSHGEWVKLLDSFKDGDGKDAKDVFLPPQAEVNKEGKVTNQRTINNAEERREAINRMYFHDVRANKWQGSALGVVQAFNTFYHWSGKRTGVGSDGGAYESNMLSHLRGNFEKHEQRVLKTLAEVTENEAALAVVGN